MAELPAKKYQEKLKDIKESVKRTYDYFLPNYLRFTKFQKFVFKSALSDDDKSLLAQMQRPQLEFNILEAYISRLLGEFSKQEPDIEVRADDPANADAQIIKMVEEHLRDKFSDEDNNHMRYQVYKDLLSGGFSVMKIRTDYSNPMSMQQDIYMERAFDPTLCGFDIISKLSHKGDGRYCFELFPMTKKQFEKDYPDIKLERVSFRKDFSGFNWAYMSNNEETLIIADYYEKKSKKLRIVQVRDGRVMLLEEYDKLVEQFTGSGLVPPAIIGKPRTTYVDKIWRYRCIENLVLEAEETEFTMLPLVFIDGNSVLIKDNQSSDVRQMTRPYVYQAEGAQKLINWAGISLANSIENEVQHKFMVAKEALPKEEQFLEAYKNVQQASILVYNSVHENNPEMPIQNPISPIPKIPAPPEIAQAFMGTSPIVQQILGSYDASLGINDNQLSGVAVVEAATQSNAAAMPYIVGFMQGLQRVAQIYVEMIPKYWVTPRSIPLKNKEGQRYYVKINQDHNPTFNYSNNALGVSLKAGASFQVQKAKTINMVKELMQMSPMFQQFISDKGLNFVLDNMDGKGISELKSEVDSWMQEQDKKKQAAGTDTPEQQEMQLNQQRLELERQKMMMSHKIDLLKLEADHDKIDASLHTAAQKDRMEVTKTSISAQAKMHDQSIKEMEMNHRHTQDHIKTIKEAIHDQT